jgi:3-deoxy-D-manno-octulosonic-acid transferase
MLVLDTMGELRDFYAASTVSFVGRDHNILEPLTFGKPVTITPGWEATFPSYPVYLLLRGTDSVQELDGPADHAHAWIQALSGSGAPDRIAKRIDDDLARLRGASARNLELMRAMLVRSGIEPPGGRS